VSHAGFEMGTVLLEHGDGGSMMLVRITTVLLGALALCAGEEAKAQTRWALPSAYPATNFHAENLNVFAKDVAGATGGKLQITVHPDAALYTAPEIKRIVQIGHANMGEVLISLHEADDPIFGIDVVPFLATSFDQAQKLWAVTKPSIEKKFAAQGLMVLFSVPWPPQGIYAKKPINTVADMKGLFWRAYNAGTRRIAEIVGAHPVTVQAADLPRALATGLINAFMTSSATGYDSRVWESMTYFYDTQAWIPKNITFVNKRAFDQLDEPTRAALLKAAADAELRGWAASQEKNRWYVDELGRNGMKVLPPADALAAGLKQVGEQLTAEWLRKAGADGWAVIEAYKKN
jgi:TRAP-type C4-dicarboxylate transport system substrate-binding protein